MWNFAEKFFTEVEQPQQGLEKTADWTKEKIAALDKPVAMEIKFDEAVIQEIPKEISELFDDYLNDLKEKSEVSSTISAKTLNDLEKTPSQEVAAKREEFNDIKSDLKKQWEEKNGMEWPKYYHDVYSSNGKLIRKAGQDYDAHHIQPLSMGGKNEVSNITPLNAEVHYDKQGVHAPDSPYAKLEKTLGE